MAVDVLAILCRHLYRGHVARRETSAFRRDSGEAVRGGRLDEVIAIAARNRRSPLPVVVSASLAAFATAPSECSNSDVIATAERAFQRTRGLLVAELRVGLTTLDTIATCAVLIGVLGTCFGVGYAFRGAAMERHTLIVRVNADSARAFALTGLGLIVSILAIIGRSVLRRSVEAFEREMLNAKLDMLASLTIRSRDQHRPEREADDASAGFLLVAPGDSAARSWGFHTTGITPCRWRCVCTGFISRST